MQRPFRFLHAADLHLDGSCQSAAEVPQHLIDLMVDAPLQAAAKVFDTAIEQRVDFILLSGDVVDPHRAAPRELLFLVQQFQRLGERNIPVYWSGGVTDSTDQWPTYVNWPGNVHRFPRGHIQRYRHEIAGTAVCEIIGSSHAESQPSRPYEFAPNSPDLFSVAVAHAHWNAGALGEIGVNYWALGGPHNRSTPLESNCVAHFAGSPQGRCSSETGPHGCTVVSVDEQLQVRLTPVTCDVLRWLTPQVSLPATANAGELEQLLRDRTDQLAADSIGVPLLVSWQVACQGALRFALRHGSLGAELTSKLQQKFGHRQSPIWTFGIEAELCDQLPTPWHAEATLRGDFLRAVQQFSTGDVKFDEQICSPAGPAANTDLESQPLRLTLPENLANLLAADNHPHISPQLLAKLGSAIDSPEVRRRLMQEIAWLGAELLSPAEAAQ
jgi:DNA repair protein SbcD/Mre11